jgi:plasmid stabilization system protein ParE
MNYRFHPAALHEYAEATQYYFKISNALATGFVSQVESGINQILLHPRARQLVEEDIRRYLINRFPFGIYYTIEEDNYVVIWAIMHLSRKPRYWKDRLLK